MSTSSDLRAPGDRARPGAPTGPSGWAPDPWRRHHARFFDGHQWTEHVADGGVAGVDSAPVAELPRSRPVPPDAAPPDGAGPRVVDEDAPADDPGLDRALLLLDLVADPDGGRGLRTPDEALAGRVAAPPPSWPTRVGRRLVSAPLATPSRLLVADVAGATHLELRRPGLRTAATVDVTGPSGPVGTVAATSVRRGLRAAVVAGDGTEVGRLEQVGADAGILRVVGGDDDVALARLTPVWDVPGSRRHLPPGVVLVDRRPHEGGRRADPAHGDLLLGALLAPLLLLPPGAPVDR
ncbi:DUF2510 domain-containing protein [Iamia majanohamensis]|uniref:DUF2510 domain-containing protein n=1 Tax=Iamia majanohamensis TaxID=467976 RepID=A0AAF0BWR4_9ACTN|nr:DUF2510 domain-containing protein [Iamia majanohamensis]WCO67749.1 DUF2510 domain-containing protein [Iamia majanohamensis]